MADFDIKDYKPDQVKTIACNCGMISRGWVKTVDGVNYSYRPCPVCKRNDNIKALFPREMFHAMRAEMGNAP